MNRVSYLTLIGFYVALVCSTLLIDWAHLTEKPDTLIHDLWVNLTPTEPPDDVVVVGVDSRSLQEIGRWPWSRIVQAKLVEELTKAGVASLTLDILFTEPDDPRNDEYLANAIVDNGRVILPILTGEYSAGRTNPEKLPVADVSLAVAGLGHVYLPVDSDGLVRRINLKSGFKAAHWSSLSLALAEMVGESPERLPGIRLPRNAISHSWVSDYQVLIPFYGPGGTFKTVSASQVIAGKVPKDVLKGKHVFVGVTAVGLGDVLPTPVSSETHPMTGVEVHATVFSALREGTLVEEASGQISFFAIAVLLAILLTFYVRFSPSLGFVAALVVASIPIVISSVIYFKMQLWYAPLSASVPLLISYPLWSWHRLEFVSHFIQGEIDEIDDDIPSITSSTNTSLVYYFDAALHHLPIKGWRFISNGDVFENGDIGECRFVKGQHTDWVKSGDHYCKQYLSKDKLQVILHIKDETIAEEITNMVDSLSRVWDRPRVQRNFDTVENLQIKALQLSARMDRLRRENAVSESIFHGSPAGLVVWNMAGEFSRMNELAYRMLPEILGGEPEFRDFIKGVGKDSDAENDTLIRALLIDRQAWQMEYEHNASELVLDFSVVGEHFADRLLLASIVDVSLIRASERARAEMVEYLSHDLRSPLISSVYLLSEEKEQTSDLDLSRIQRIENNINRSLHMIDDILDLSRAENLKKEELSPVLFDNVVSNSIDQVMPQSEGKDIEIRLIQNEDDDLWVNGNAILLERSLINVLGNAIKYSPNHTLVTLTVEDRNNDFLRCSVADEGIGMDQNTLQTLFKRFHRDESVEREYQGAGLGLALVSRVVAQHSGRVWAESQGVGSTIVIELPLLYET